MWGCSGGDDDQGGDDTPKPDAMVATPDAPEGEPDAMTPAPDAAVDGDAMIPAPDAAGPDATPPDAPVPTDEVCDDAVDNDLDGTVDCGDSDCASTLVCMTPACPAGQTSVLLEATGLPMFIKDNQTTAVAVNVADAGVVTSAAVQVAIVHMYLGDVDISLRSPAGTLLDLSSDNGGSGDNYQNTVFIDTAATPVTSGSAPFLGAYKPEQPLSGLVGTPAAGAWTLEVFDDATPDPGVLAGYSLHLCVCASCEVGLACVDGQDNDGDTQLDCDDADCAGVPQCQLETACADAVDNNLDGLTDCADPDCAAAVQCQPEASCNNGTDDNMNGQTDCLDASCAAACAVESDCGNGMDDDMDGQVDCADIGCAASLACLPACPAGQATVLVNAAGLPLAVADNTTVTAALPVATGGIVTSAAVSVDITHTYDGDVDIALKSPAGTIVDLSSDNGGGDDNYAGTLFTDGAATAVTAGSAPFKGAFKPEQPLSTVADQGAAGEWQLLVSDDATTDSGTLNAAALRLCVCTSCETGVACGDGVDNDGDGQTDCADGDCAAALQCATETACADGLDNNADGLVDCADPDCAVACTTESDCGDGMDNDGDGAVDCSDVGCVAMGGACEAEEQSCSDGADNDGDAMIDCADPACAWACTSNPCPMGQDLVVLGKAGPLPVPDVATVDSVMSTARPGNITSMAVRINVTHSWDSDLDIFLVPPAGMPTVELTTDNGSSGDNYVDTVFIDSAAASITTGAAPFTGQFRPETPLSPLSASPLAGSWTLRLTDDESALTGVLQYWQIAFCVAPAGP
jgi:subtilisin-like proprotein convertase family protein